VNAHVFYSKNDFIAQSIRAIFGITSRDSQEFYSRESDIEIKTSTQRLINPREIIYNSVIVIRMNHVSFIFTTTRFRYKHKYLNVSKT